MRIKRFIQISIVLSIILLSLLYGLSWIYINYVNDRTVKFMEYSKLEKNTVSLLTLGSSHAKYGIRFDKNTYMNLALEQQGMYYNLKIFEKYQEKLKKGSIVIIPISIFSFTEIKTNENNEKNRNYISLLDYKNIAKDIKIMD